MKLPEHIALSLLIAQFGVQQQFGPAGTALVIAAGLLPDADSASVLAGWRCHRRYHRVVGHGLPVILGGPFALALLGSWWLGEKGFATLWYWLQVSLLAHVVTDFLFSRWPVQVFWPLSRWGIGLGLISWNDLVPTLLLYAGAGSVLLGPVEAPLVAGVTLTAFALYLCWRIWQPPPETGWPAWVAGGWARRSPRWSRWLTGDFIT